MSVFIKEMPLPKNCCVCDLCDGEYGREYYEKTYCRVRREIRTSPKRRPKDCPLVEVKTPHGRLIDADEFYEAYEPNSWSEGMAVTAYIKNAPTVIEAEVE